MISQANDTQVLVKLVRDAKVMDLEELVKVVSRHQTGGRTVIHCHGVFDLLHLGHIRYLQKAKTLADILVVTVTPDRYVNKGIHRPAFPDRLRAEALAALSCVDYVAINEWPTAAETIGLLRPDVYAKGAEFCERKTPEILREEAALAGVGGRMAFIEDIVFSSSTLINKYLSCFPDEVNNYLAEVSEQYSLDEILGYLHGARGLRTLVVGEAIIDEYYYCEQMGRSSKAPIVATRYTSHEEFAGGSILIANHLGNFCDEVCLLTMVGTKDAREDWIRTQLQKNVRGEFFRKTDCPTITKRRYREAYFTQPMFETYVMDDRALAEAENEALCRQLQRLLPDYDLVLVVDYGHGMLSDEAIDVLCSDARFLAVNTQANAGNHGLHTISKYWRTHYFSLAEQELYLECRRRTRELRPLLRGVAKRLNAERGTVTRGKYGCLCCDEEGNFAEAPALATQVKDRVGAGDTFLAITALCAVQKAPLPILAFLGNVAGAEAVATVGTGKSLDKLALCRHVESLLK